MDLTPSQEAARDAGRFDIDVGTEHNFLGGVYAKRMSLPAGYHAVSHSHPYTHMSVLAKGRVVVETDRSRMEYTAPAYITIERDVHHRINAIEDTIWFCIHVTDCKDESLIDDVILRKD